MASGGASDGAGREGNRPEENRLIGRARRHARVGLAGARFGARLALGGRRGREDDDGRRAAELAQALGGLKGPLMKVAQLLAAIPDALPPRYATELQQLQAQAPAMGWPFVRRRMAGELGADWERRFAAFERQAAAAASLGQVHRALAKDGSALACKLQYPDMASAVEADVAQLRLVFALWRRWDKAVDPRRIHEEIAQRLREELDYERERRHLGLYRIMLRDEARVTVPGAVAALSTRRLLTMEWLDGAPLAQAESLALERRNRIALAMFQAWYRPFYGFGVIHGDPHPGNYTLRADDGVNLLDFGCVRVFSPRFVTGVIDLYRALRDGNKALARHAYETWGFADLSDELMETLDLWARFVYAPLLEDKARAIQDEGTAYGARVAGRVHARLRELGPVTVPREFVLMDRAAIGLGGVFLRLGAEVNWHRVFHGLIDGYDEARLAQRQRQALREAGLEAPAPAGG